MVESESFGERLRRLRQTAGLSQEGLADRAGLTPAAIGALERGDRRYPYPGTLQALAQALDLSPSEREALFVSVPKRSRGGAALLRHSPPPLPLTPLVGRDRDLAVVAGLFRRSDARIVTLTGSPGVGKTRLAVELATRLPGDLGIGAAWVDLSLLSDPERVLSAIARALALREQEVNRTAEVLESYLARRRLILVLDTFEHLLPATPYLVELVGRCPGLFVLVTSREALGVRGEHQYVVPPLRPPDKTDSIAGIEQSDAVALFLERARSVAPATELGDADASTIAAICVRLEGIPLALELAAAQLKYMAPSSLLQRLERRLAILEGGPRDLPDRQRSLRATIEWSYELLDEADKALFRKLSVFEGGFTQEAAIAVCGHGRHLRSLVDKSLVQLVDRSAGEARYAVLDTLREYARERLVGSGEERMVAEAHAAFYSRMAETAAPHTSTAGRGPWLRHLEVEWPNLRASLAWAVNGGDISIGLKIAGALGWFWNLRGYVVEGREWTERLLASAAGCDPMERADALYVAATLAWKQGDHVTARQRADESVDLRRALGDNRGLAFSLAASGLIATSEGRLEEARSLQEGSLALFRKDEEPWGIAYGLSNLGDALQEARDLAGARRLYDESLDVFSRLGDSWGSGIVLHALGGIDLAAGAWADARARYAESSGHFSSFGNVENEARSLIGLGAAALALGETDEAERSLSESLAIWRDLAFAPGIAICLDGLAAVAASQGEYRAAARLFGAADGHKRNGAAVFMVDPKSFSNYLEQTRAQLDEAVFSEDWADGASVDLDSIGSRSE